jgi:hypothetical protein
LPDEKPQAQIAGPGRRCVRQLSDFEWLAVAFALLCVHAAFFRKLIYSASCCDAAGYQELGRNIVDHGLFSAAAFSALRTYGYPLFLSALRLLERFTTIPLALLTTEFQLCIYLLAVWLLRNEIRRIWWRFGQWLFVAFCLNVFVLIYAAEALTESLSLSIVVLLGWCWLWSVRIFRSRRWMLAAATGGLLAGLAVMVRPANLFLPAAWIAGQAFLVLSRRIGPRPGEATRRAAVFVLMLVAVAVPSVPQFYNNIVFANAMTPLVAFDLGSLQVNVGITKLKYATARPPVKALEIYYVNPFADAANGIRIDPAHPLRWYRENPIAGFKTVLLHAFALLDQDLIFPFIVDLSPSYRIPLAVLNHVGIGLALWALWLWIRSGRRVGRDGPLLRISLPLVMIYILGVVVIYGTACVEARFGLPLILLAAPLALAAIRHFQRLTTRRLVLPGATIAVYTVLAIATSGWMRSQSPAISEWEHRGRNPNLALFKPARQSSTFGRWGPQKGVDGIRTAGATFGGFHTDIEPNPWWEVDLGATYRLTQVRLYNAPPYTRAATLRMLLSQDDRNWTEVYSNAGRPFDADPRVVNLNGNRARYVRVQLSDRTWLHLDEVEVYGSKP